MDKTFVLDHELDRPVSLMKEDKLGRLIFAKRLSSALVSSTENVSTGAVVGLLGEWGSGKSSVLNFVEQEIKETAVNAVVLRFDPWLISDRDALVAVFLNDLSRALADDGSENRTSVKKVRELLSKYQKLIYFGADALSLITAPISGFPVFLSSILKFVPGVGKLVQKHKEGEKKSIHQTKVQIESAVAELSFPIVVLIDELDRLDDDEIKEILRLVKSVADFPNISYLIAYDADRVIEALGSGAFREDADKRGRSYLEKIVQHQIQLPAIFENELKQMLRNQVASLLGKEASLEIFDDQSPYSRLEQAIFPNLIRTPRDLKRCISIFSIQQNMIGGEVSWLDVLGYSILLTKTPSVANKIRVDPLFFSDDFGSSGAEYYRYGTVTPTNRKQLTELLGESWPKQPEAQLLCFLFPRFIDLEVSDDHDDGDRSRIRNYRALSFLVRLGTPPESLSINRVNELSQLPIEELGLAMEKTRREGKIPDLDYFLSYQYDRLSEHDPSQFWVGIAKSCSKGDSRTFSQMQSMSDLCHSMSIALTRAANHSSYLRENSVDIVKSLHRHELSDFLAHFLRNEIYAHGFFRIKQRSEYVKLSDEKEIFRIINSVAAEWKRQHLGSDWFFSTWRATPMWLMRDADVWDESCKQKLREITAKHSAFDCLLLMLFGGNYTVDISTIEEIIGLEHFKKAMTEADPSSNGREVHGDVTDVYNKVFGNFDLDQKGGA